MNEQMASKKSNIYNMTLIGLMAAILCIVGPLMIPIGISPVPISITNLAIFLTVFVLGWKRGTLSYLVYLLLGAVGLPVFSGFQGGLEKLTGYTGGYLIGFILMAIIAGIFIEKFNGKWYMYVVGMVLGSIVTYLIGTLWLAYLMNATFGKALLMGVVPYLLGDGIKIAIAVIVGAALKKRLTRSGLV